MTTIKDNIVNLWVDNSVVGCGERLFVVLKVGSKQVSLFDPNQLRATVVERAIFERNAKPAPVHPRKVRAVLRANARAYRRLKLHYPKRAVQAAEVILEMKGKQ